MPGAGGYFSPIASIFELGSFVNALTELAFTAEVASSTPSIVTQVRKPEKGAALDTTLLTKSLRYYVLTKRFNQEYQGGFFKA